MTCQQGQWVSLGGISLIQGGNFILFKERRNLKMSAIYQLKLSYQKDIDIDLVCQRSNPTFERVIVNLSEVNVEMVCRIRRFETSHLQASTY